MIFSCILAVDSQRLVPWHVNSGLICVEAMCVVFNMEGSGGFSRGLPTSPTGWTIQEETIGGWPACSAVGG
jgi:hypothetical protein